MERAHPTRSLSRFPQATLSMISRTTSRPPCLLNLTTLQQKPSPFEMSPSQTTTTMTKSPLCLTRSSPRTRRNSKRRVNCPMSGKTRLLREPFTSSSNALLKSMHQRLLAH